MTEARYAFKALGLDSLSILLVDGPCCVLLSDAPIATTTLYRLGEF